MHLAKSDGDFECRCWNKLENLLRERTCGPCDDVWLWGDTEYPRLAILIHDKAACVHYFQNDAGDMWQSAGYGTEDVTFFMSGDACDMPANCVIPLDKAIECAKQFFDMAQKPDCIAWRAL